MVEHFLREKINRKYDSQALFRACVASGSMSGASYPHMRRLAGRVFADLPELQNSILYKSFKVGSHTYHSPTLLGARIDVSC